MSLYCFSTSIVSSSSSSSAQIYSPRRVGKYHENRSCAENGCIKHLWTDSQPTIQPPVSSRAAVGAKDWNNPALQPTRRAKATIQWWTGRRCVRIVSLFVRSFISRSFLQFLWKACSLSCFRRVWVIHCRVACEIIILLRCRDYRIIS